MEHITEAQKRKYEDLLSQIDNEFEKKKKIEEEIVLENNKIIALTLPKRNGISIQELFQANVKVFDSVFQIYEFCDGEISKSELNELSKHCDKKYYFVTVYVSQRFLKLISQDCWFLSVRLRNPSSVVVKNSGITSNCSPKKNLIVPFDSSIEDVKVDVTIVIKIGSVWIPMNIFSQIVDISYHFKSYSETELATFKNRIFSLLSNYQSNLFTVPNLEYEFQCKCSIKHFFNVITSNSYFKLDSKIFGGFTGKKNVVDIKLCTESGGLVMCLDNQEGILKISSSSVMELSSVKRLLIKNLKCQKLDVEKIWLVTLKNLGNYIRSELLREDLNFESIKTIYKELNKLKYRLPV